MANSKLKLYYFDIRGRGEVARLILAAAGKRFEDIRFTLDDWPEYKKKAPYGQAPLLEVDGVIFAQSLAINAFLAREFGFHGKTSLEIFKIDEIAHLVEDFVLIVARNFHLNDEAEKTNGILAIKVNDATRYFRFLEKILETNGTGYFVGDRLTLADILFFDVVTGFCSAYVDVTNEFPMLKNNMSRVCGNAGISAYVAGRKDSSF
ncbi:unnamed protein product [Lymnaea stagnalis]|uniref:Glutathione transferase n=1 Tax=Lymnaea stagnalis TaxID=6523 RepID=A0AAV2IQV4_LYMST